MSQQKAWDCPECGQKNIHKKGFWLPGPNGKKVCVPCGKRILAEKEKPMFAMKLPVTCPLCCEKGLVLLYDYQKQELQSLCYMREDPKGRFIQGCGKIVFSFPMTEAEYRSLCEQPLIQENFFFMLNLR